MKTCKTVLASRQAVHTTPPAEAMISLGLVVPLEAPVRTAGRGGRASSSSSAPSTPPSALGGRRRNSGGSNSAERRRTTRQPGDASGVLVVWPSKNRQKKKKTKSRLVSASSAEEETSVGALRSFLAQGRNDRLNAGGVVTTETRLRAMGPPVEAHLGHGAGIGKNAVRAILRRVPPHQPARHPQAKVP